MKVRSIESIYDADYEQGIREATERYKRGLADGEGWQWDGDKDRDWRERDSQSWESEIFRSSTDDVDFRAYKMPSCDEVGVMFGGPGGDWAVVLTHAEDRDYSDDE